MDEGCKVNVMRYKVGASIAMVAGCVGDGRDGVGTGGTVVSAVEGDGVGWRHCFGLELSF